MNSDPPHVSLLPSRRTAFYLFLGFLLLALSTAFATGPTVSKEYYAIVAQVLPVFWLVAALQQRVFRLRKSYGLDRYFVAFNYFTLVAGEAAALTAVATGCRSNRLLFLLTVQALIVSIGFVTDAALSDEDDPQT